MVTTPKAEHSTLSESIATTYSNDAAPVAPIKSHDSEPNGRKGPVQRKLYSEDDLLPGDEAMAETTQKPTNPPGRDYVWRNIIFFVYLHVASVYGVYLGLTTAKWYTLAWFAALYTSSGWGVTAGAHRLWSHRSFKARLPVRFVLLVWNCIAGQNHVIEWARDHRVHHKFSETDADPHDARRGFFFSHIGWLLVKKHPEVKRKGRLVDVSDLEKDPLLAFQKRHYVTLSLFFNYAFPVLVAMLWGESPLVAFVVCSLLRYCAVLHATWSVNSFAHMFGYRPYDKNINPRESYVSITLSLGEGFHNYHHSFPFDYRASEWTWTAFIGLTNLTTILIDILAFAGLVYDRKAVSKGAIDAKKARSGATDESAWSQICWQS